jgi:signal peptidase II
MADRISRYTASAIACSVFCLDRWTKYIIETRFSFYDTKIVIPGFFDIVRSQNPGIAFGLFAQSTSRFRTGLLISFSLIAVAILIGMLLRIERLDRMNAIALSLIFGGALGNVFDRIRLGMVTDFLDFYVGNWHWYTFNLADTAICIGAGLLMLAMLRSRGSEKESTPVQSEART